MIDAETRIERLGERIRRLMGRLGGRIERLGYRGYYRLADLTYALGIATPKRTVGGTYRSYEPTNPHGDDPGLAALADLPPDATVFDVGAHVGEYAIPLAVGTDRRVVAFEPNGGSADRLVRNVGRNGVAGRVDVRRTGIGNANEERTFYRSTFSKCSAFDRAEATRWGARVAAAEPVPIRRLDDLVAESLPLPDAIKVDVEGREPSALRGAADTIERARPLLVVEVHGADREIRTWLADRGYDVAADGDVLVCRAETGTPPSSPPASGSPSV